MMPCVFHPAHWHGRKPTQTIEFKNSEVSPLDVPTTGNPNIHAIKYQIIKKY